MLKVDGSHKYVKLVRVFDSGAAGGTKPVHCMVTFFNVFEQVRCEWLIRAEIQFQYEVYLSGPFFFLHQRRERTLEYPFTALSLLTGTVFPLRRMMTTVCTTR